MLCIIWCLSKYLLCLSEYTRYSISHIEKVMMDDMKAFFYTYYRPNNAVLTISGNVRFEEIVPLVEKWFGPIPAGPALKRQYPQEWFYHWPCRENDRCTSCGRDVLLPLLQPKISKDETAL